MYTNAPGSSGKMLLASPSSLTMYQLAKSAHRFDMSVQVCTDVGTALALVKGQKFDAVTIDLSLGRDAASILEETRQSPANRAAIAFAISSTPEQSSAAFHAGSSFVLERPLSMDTIRRTLHAAHGMILRERRRYFRCPVKVPASIRQEGSANQIFGETSDVSEGGMALHMLMPLKVGTDGMVQFTLPETFTLIRAEAKVIRCDDNGQAGVEFLALSDRDNSQLQQWVAKKFDDLLPTASPFSAAAWCELT